MMFDLTPEEARLLLNVALMAAGGNRFQSAEKILRVLEQFRPDAPSVAIGNAITLISAMRFADCVGYIDEVAHRKFPDSAMLKAFKGMALMRMNRNDEAGEVLAEAARAESDPVAAKLAGDLLGEA